MFGNVLTYDAYHLGLYLLSALAWGMLGLDVLLRAAGLRALLLCCSVFGVGLLFNGVVLLFDIRRTLEHQQVEIMLLIGGALIPGAVLVMCRALFSSKKSLKLL